MKLEGLSPELREEVLACETPEEILALARKVGHDLSDDELEAIAGGDDKWEMIGCPRCDSWDCEKRTSLVGNTFYVCLSCGNRWTYD